MEIVKTIIFAFALTSTIYFLGGLVVWGVSKIAPENCKRALERKDINRYNISIVIGIILWSVLFYISL